MPYKNIEDKRASSRRSRKPYLERNPWAKTWQAIKSRCLNKKHGYFIRGIKNFLKTADVKYLWFRDKAYNMDKPSIDRIDRSGHYTLENCRFMELRENLRRPRTRGGYCAN